MLRGNRGALLVANLMAVGLVSLLVTTYFSVIQHEIASVDRVMARVQALYLAEAGLDAANDLLAQDWESYRRGTNFPLREGLSTSLNGHTVNVGEFEVLVSAMDDQTLQVTSTGRSLPRPAQSGHASSYAMARTFTMVVARKDIPRFQRLGRNDILELEAYYFNKDGVPDLLALSGELANAHGQDPDQDERLQTSEGLHAKHRGMHLLASFTDVDLDGDLDLVLCGVPFSTRDHARSLMPTRSHAKEGAMWRLMTTTAGDILGKKHILPVVTQGWLWLPEGSLTGVEPDAEIFINSPTYDGTLIVSWGEVP